MIKASAKSRDGAQVGAPAVGPPQACVAQVGTVQGCTGQLRSVEYGTLKSRVRQIRALKVVPRKIDPTQITQVFAKERHTCDSPQFGTPGSSGRQLRQHPLPTRLTSRSLPASHQHFRKHVSTYHFRKHVSTYRRTHPVWRCPIPSTHIL